MKLPNPKDVIVSVFPILKWSRRYGWDTGVGDLIAGMTVALTLIPQSIAYSSLAGLEPQYGLYASFAGSFVYTIMGSCPQINIGPTALLSLLTFSYTHDTNPDYAIFLCFVGGIVMLIAGCAQLGFLVEFVSTPVVSGFTSAAAVTIASSQIKGLLGLQFSSESFIDTWKGIFTHIQNTRLQDTLLSLACCVVLMGMEALKDVPIKEPVDKKLNGTAEALKKFLWFAAVARNAVVVILASVVAFFVYEDKNYPLILTGDITPGLPQPQIPPFSTSIGNVTYTTKDIVSHLGSGLIVLPLVGIISNVAIAKAFAQGKKLDATQEIIALGVCNIVGAFFKSYPVNGSFSRSAVSNASGVRTPAAGFCTGIIVILTLALLTPYFFFIPRAALSAVIVCAVLHMVNVSIIKQLWRSNSRLDIIPLVGTFICCLVLSVEMGLLCGVGIDVLLLLYYHSRPPLQIEYVDDATLPPYYTVRPAGGWHFAGAERLRSRLLHLQSSKHLQQPVISLETLTVIPDTDHENDSRNELNGVRNNNGNVQSNGRDLRENELSSIASNSTNTLRAPASNGVQQNNVSVIRERRVCFLVVYCDDLFRIDYTVLQSMKSLVSEWSKNGHVLWCNASPALKKKLENVIPNAIFCDSQQLNSYLTGYPAVEESQTGTTNSQL